MYIKILYTTTHSTTPKKCLPQYFFHYSTAETTDPMLTLPSIVNERKRNKIKRAMRTITTMIMFMNHKLYQSDYPTHAHTQTDQSFKPSRTVLILNATQQQKVKSVC